MIPILAAAGLGKKILTSEAFWKVVAAAAVVAAIMAGIWYVRSLTDEIASLEVKVATADANLKRASAQKTFWKGETERIQKVLDEKAHNERVNSEQMSHLLTELYRLQEEFPDVAKLYHTDVPDPVLGALRAGVLSGDRLPEAAAAKGSHGSD